LARATFQGRFADRMTGFDRRRRGGHPAVIGWVGPLFWPYAYSDFIDYTFYPYAYDTFWPILLQKSAASLYQAGAGFFEAWPPADPAVAAAALRSGW
jgi:hypothetical protein